MNLLLLALEIQEELLILPKVTGKDVITEKLLRPIVAMVDWVTQAAMQRSLRSEKFRKPSDPASQYLRGWLRST